MGFIAEEVQRLQGGDSERLIARMKSGFAVFGAVQITRGYALLYPDPVVPHLNAMLAPARLQFLDDMATLGEALYRATGALRINYEILGNVVPELHAHVIPRYADEALDLREKPVFLHDWKLAPAYAEPTLRGLLEELRAILKVAGGVRD